MSLCPTCRKVNVPNLTRELNDLPLWWANVTSSLDARGLIHHNDARALTASASTGCPLCILIVDSVLHASPLASVVELREQLVNLPIYLQTNYDRVKPSFPEDSEGGSWHIRGAKVFVPVDDGSKLTGRIRLYAARDSPAGISGDIIGRPLLSASDSPEAFDLVSRWMSACLTRHRSCRQTLSGSEIDESEPPILPSRILQIGKSGEIVTTKLLVANGARGHYVALSHCWGARTHHPPMTTQSNLDHHLAGIPWTALPRLYQEAITATSRLGFSYLWIDSLCIIQDSHLDWLAESKRMGDVYQHARLTIAASHATDSNQPCFFPREPVPQAVALASPDSTTAYDGVYVTSMPTDYTPISPEFGALAYRAWATQEWLLSRRMLFYTAGHLVWSCKTITQRETGASFHDTARNPRWKNIVEKYSARQLTKPSDRLVALEGVRSELQRKRPDDVYCYGLWKNAMPDQLLWYCVHKGEEGMRDLKLPSWTWASRLAKVRFLDVEGMKNTCKWFRVDEDERRLGIGGVVRKIESVTPLGDGTREASSSVVSNVPWEIVDPALLFGIGDGAGSMIGWCVLDDYEVSKGNVFGLQLMSKTVKTREDGIKLKTYIDNVLLMQRKEALEESFMRIGVGVLTMSTPWLGDIPHQSINIR